MIKSEDQLWANELENCLFSFVTNHYLWLKYSQCTFDIEKKNEKKIYSYSLKGINWLDQFQWEKIFFSFHLTDRCNFFPYRFYSRVVYITITLVRPIMSTWQYSMGLKNGISSCVQYNHLSRTFYFLTFHYSTVKRKSQAVDNFFIASNKID